MPMAVMLQTPTRQSRVKLSGDCPEFRINATVRSEFCINVRFVSFGRFSNDGRHDDVGNPEQGA
jgi:hypothetical protein